MLTATAFDKFPNFQDLRVNELAYAKEMHHTIVEYSLKGTPYYILNILLSTGISYISLHTHLQVKALKISKRKKEVNLASMAASQCTMFIRNET